jgi:hypothetical protein
MRQPAAVDADVEAALPDARYERKFLARSLCLEEVLSAVRRGSA